MSDIGQGEVETIPSETGQESKTNLGDGDCAPEVKASSADHALPPSAPTDAGDSLSATESVNTEADLAAEPVTDTVDEYTRPQTAATTDSESGSGDAAGDAGHSDGVSEGQEILQPPSTPTSTTSHDDYSDPSCRVLKPPGGGTSDIFGGAEAPVQNSPRRAARNNLQSSVFGPPTNDGNPVTGEGYIIEEKQSASNNAAPPAAQPTTNGTSHSAPPQRARVPPGGFSSGLW